MVGAAKRLFNIRVDGFRNGDNRPTEQLMEKSPKQVAAMAIRTPERREWLLTASPREIQQFIHLNANNEYGRPDHELATVALNVRIAEDAEKQSLRLET